FIINQLSERDQRQSSGTSPLPNRQRTLLRGSSDLGSHSTSKPDNTVTVLLAQHKSKKTNKFQIVEAAQDAARQLLDSYRGAQIAAIETRDEIVDVIGKTRLSDADSWKQATQAVPGADRG